MWGSYRWLIVQRGQGIGLGRDVQAGGASQQRSDPGEVGKNHRSHRVRAGKATGCHEIWAAEKGVLGREGQRDC